jgi:hypothetical protein
MTGKLTEIRRRYGIEIHVGGGTKANIPNTDDSSKITGECKIFQPYGKHN